MSEKSGWRCGLAQVGIIWMRLALGSIFTAHGLQKVFGLWGGHGLSATVASFEQMGIQTGLAYAAIFTELLGGIAVLAGFLTRIASLGLSVVMGYAVYKIHWVNGFFLQNQGFEYNVALLGLSLGLLFTGAGCLSLDSMIFCGKCKEEIEEPPVATQ